ncbi:MULTISPECIES: hypothetical protein [unclassified Streptomyces]|uniref:hypothetical protein n=1 Tax=unclassified Streptomyces TaxID=2593676 RepID=UPI00093C3470|nr:hypothetical protein [Streptomyces sp. CB01883]
MNDDAQVLALLHALDLLPGPNHLQFPNGFDHTAAMVRATRLKERLTEDFRHACELDDHINDASYSFHIVLPAEAPRPAWPWECD